MLFLLRKKRLTKIEHKVEANRTACKSLVEIIIIKAIILPNTQNLSRQKTSGSFGNFYIENYKHRG